ncbi:MAG: phosphoribosylformylglycinamidine synthase [Gammaproteobacteria bacterium]|nr:phosphoribosylformylglycinamidine synthase [Gammaproteobacteria bacterium]MYF37820.1 phosphoribosylformylglycinamidine synthase [Gammaproteobacteria bacterium]
MTELYIHAGGVAHGNSVYEKLLEQLRQINPNSSCVYASFVHIAKLRSPLSEQSKRIANSLLTYGTPAPVETKTQHRCTVVPRLGTISPWSSKATDVFRLCGLDVVERVERGVRWYSDAWTDECANLLFDRMTESLLAEESFEEIFVEPSSRPLSRIELQDEPFEAIQQVNRELGLALSEHEIQYLVDVYHELGRDPTDVELMMFGQVNSEHCRHKIFNADWIIHGKASPVSLFQKIRTTTGAINARGILSAYRDNAAVIEGAMDTRFCPDPKSRFYQPLTGLNDILMKVETHNHPTAISPFPGAATGSGGEIRDEGAVGRGSKPKAGLVGFTTSHLRIPGHKRTWESELRKPNHLASPLEIMLDGPLGAAGYNNEYGRPALTGYFRTFEHRVSDEESWGYHKPIMIAGGIGSVFREHVHEEIPQDSSVLVVLGGPSMLIGLGGGSSSSMTSGLSDVELDFASVQRDNAELERRCQEVVDTCTALLQENPIQLIHDVGAGGLSNAIPELVRDLGKGAVIDLRAIPSADSGLSPLELWCNEAQERYVLSVPQEKRELFEEICTRERCPFAVIGYTNDRATLTVKDDAGGEPAINLSLETLFGSPPRIQRRFTPTSRSVSDFSITELELAESISLVLSLPSVASKKFLITIGDRSITGFVARDQMVGPYQVPVADAAITIGGFETYTGEAMAVGERSPVATLNPSASARLAIAEALTNLSSVRYTSIDRIVLSANWMAACGFNSEDEALHDAVTAATTLCRSLGIAIPVGKDSLSMRTQWTIPETTQTVVSPVSLIASAFVPVPDVRQALTPRLVSSESVLVLLELSSSRRLGGSALAQVHGCLGAETPDVEDASKLRRLLEVVQRVHEEQWALSMHDRSDGGLIATVLEMSFSSRLGVDLHVRDNWARELFAEEIGVVLEVPASFVQDLIDLANANELVATQVGQVRADEEFRILYADQVLLADSILSFEKSWAQTSYLMQRIRDDSNSADSEFALIEERDPGLHEKLTFSIDQRRRPKPRKKHRPRVAVLRDQGVNGHIEMGAAFYYAGFDSVDVHMTDLFSKRMSLEQFQVLAACGGFSYGDVLGGGGGWAKSILFNDLVRAQFEEFFNRDDSLALGVCNGCQMMVQLRELIPGTTEWPVIHRNTSDRFEARSIQVKILNSNSVWLKGMSGSQVPIPVAHGEGRVDFPEFSKKPLHAEERFVMQYVDGMGEPTERYPLNPNGSVNGIAGFTSENGNVLAMMPHPERVFRTIQNSWYDPRNREREFGPWFQLFRNAFDALN